MRGETCTEKKIKSLILIPLELFFHLDIFLELSFLVIVISFYLLSANVVNKRIPYLLFSKC